MNVINMTVINMFVFDSNNMFLFSRVFAAFNISCSCPQHAAHCALRAAHGASLRSPCYESLCEGLCGGLCGGFYD